MKQININFEQNKLKRLVHEEARWRILQICVLDTAAFSVYQKITIPSNYFHFQWPGCCSQYSIHNDRSILLLLTQLHLTSLLGNPFLEYFGRLLSISHRYIFHIIVVSISTCLIPSASRKLNTVEKGILNPLLKYNKEDNILRNMYTMVDYTDKHKILRENAPNDANILFNNTYVPFSWNWDASWNNEHTFNMLVEDLQTSTTRPLIVKYGNNTRIKACIDLLLFVYLVFAAISSGSTVLHDTLSNELFPYLRHSGLHVLFIKQNTKFDVTTPLSRSTILPAIAKMKQERFNSILFGINNENYQTES